MKRLLQEAVSELKKLNAHADNIEHILQPTAQGIKADIAAEVNSEKIASMLEKLLLSHQ